MARPRARGQDRERHGSPVGRPGADARKRRARTRRPALARLGSHLFFLLFLFLAALSAPLPGQAAAGEAGERLAGRSAAHRRSEASPLPRQVACVPGAARAPAAASSRALERAYAASRLGAASAPGCGPRRRPRWREARVAHVIDGDSLAVRVGRRRVEVRVAGIDAPEWRQPFGREARAYLDRLVGHGRVRLRRRARDRYGRTVADVRLADGRRLALVMVAAGLAWHDDRYHRDAELAAAEARARRLRLGLWARPCPEPPWRYRRRHPRR